MPSSAHESRVPQVAHVFLTSTACVRTTRRWAWPGQRRRARQLRGPSRLAVRPVLFLFYRGRRSRRIWRTGRVVLHSFLGLCRHHLHLVRVGGLVCAAKTLARSLAPSQLPTPKFPKTQIHPTTGPHLLTPPWPCGIVRQCRFGAADDWEQLFFFYNSAGSFAY